MGFLQCGFTCLLGVAICFIRVTGGQASECSASRGQGQEPDYSAVMAEERKVGIAFNDLPGFTRSVYQRDYALVTPESRVWAGPYGWKNTLTAHIISPASGANFAMYLADLKAQADIPAAPGVERFFLVVSGSVAVGNVILAANHFAYFPANGTSDSITSDAGATLVVYERVYRARGSPAFLHGHVDSLPLLPAPGEVFGLRKALPQTTDYDFNVHIMDFEPGQHLYVKEVHYNQHGLLLLEGQGIYRLANDWYPVQAGDAIWMAPYVPQWYAALGNGRSRYVLYKDTTIDPLFS